MQKQDKWNELDYRLYMQNSAVITNLLDIAEQLKRANLRIQEKYQHLPLKPECKEPENLVR